MSSGKVKELFCGKCKKITDHVSVSCRDYVEMTGGGNDGIRKAAGVLADVPMMNVVVGTVYKCKKCGAFRSKGRIWGDDYTL